MRCLIFGGFLLATIVGAVAPRQLFSENFSNTSTLRVNWSTKSPFGADELHSNAAFGERQVYVGEGGGYGNPSPFGFTADGLTITAKPIAAAYRPVIPQDAIPVDDQGDPLIPYGTKYEYTSGCIVAAQQFKAPFYAEVDAKITKAAGMWNVGEFFGYPMKGVPELDFMQVTGKYPSTTWDVVYDSRGNKVTNIGAKSVDLSLAFHKYGMEMTADGRQTFYLDRKAVGSGRTPITQQLLLTFNLAVGDTWDSTSTDSYTGIPNGATGTMTIRNVTVWDRRPF